MSKKVLFISGGLIATIVLVLVLSSQGVAFQALQPGTVKVPLECSEISECEEYVDSQITQGNFHPEVANYKDSIECNNICTITVPRQAPEGVEEI